MRVFTLSKADIEQLVDYHEIIDSIEQSFADYSAGKAMLPPVTNLDITDANGEVHIKSGHIQSLDNYCIKIASGFWDNPSRGLPSGNGMMLLFNAATGELTGLLFDEGLLTDLRTAAAGAVAAKHLSKRTAVSAGVLGTGVQARLQIIMLALIRKLDTVYVWGRNPENVEKYRKDMAAELPDIEVISCESPSAAAERSDILVTATPARTPLISKSDLHEGLHITALGSDGADKQEVDEDSFPMFDKVVVDHLDQCSRLGELHHALEKGTFSQNNVHAEIGGIINGDSPGREHDKEITLCDLTGVAVQDIAIANWAVKKAHAMNLGRMIEII